MLFAKRYWLLLTGFMFLLSCDDGFRSKALPAERNLERPSPGTSRDSFVFDCQTDRLQQITIVQQGLDVCVDVFLPGGEKWFSWDAPCGGTGIELFLFSPPTEGRYRLEVRAFEKSQDGTYQISRQVHALAPPYLAMHEAVAKVLEAEAMVSVDDAEALSPDNIEKAAAALAAAKKIWLELDRPIQAAMTWWRYAAMMEQQHQLNEAIEGYRDVLKILEKTESAAMTSLAHYRLAILCYQRGFFAAAVQSLEHCIALRPHPDLSRAHALNYLGRIYTYMGATDMGLTYLTEARDIFISWGDRANLAPLYAELGWQQHHRKNFHEALAHYREAMSLGMGTRPESNNLLHSYRALTYLAMGESNQALEALDAQKPYLSEIHDPVETAIWHINRAEAQILRKNWQSAEKALRRSMTRIPESRTHVQAHLRYNLARALHGQGQDGEAVTHAKEAVRLADSIQLAGLPISFRVRYSVSRDIYADFLFELLVGNEPAPAWQALSFHESRRHLMQDGKPFATKMLEQAMLSALVREMVTATLAQPGLLNEQGRPFSDLVEKADISVKPPSLDSVHDLADRATLIYFANGSDFYHAWVFQGRAVTYHKLAARKVLEPIIRDHYEAMKTAATIEGYERTNRFAVHLSEILLLPVRERLKGKDLIIVPDGELFHVPFAALFLPEASNQPEFMAVQFTVNYLSSLSQGIKLMHTPIAARQSGPLFLVAAPDFAGKYTDLEGSKAEITCLQAHGVAAGVRTISLTGHQATKQNVLFHRALAQAQIIHFATHARYLEAQSSESYLVFATIDENGHPLDSHLHPHEIDSLDLKADLVTLSACETALAQDIRIRGIGGFPKAFLDAGAKGVLVSLWQIDDQATTTLMDYFYRALLLEQREPAQALQAAQTKMIDHPRWSSPYFWSGFIYIGRK